MIVIDESTTIKNPRALRTKALIKLGNMANYKRILTGEPVTRSPLDLYSQCQFLDDTLLGFSSYYSFRNRYAIMNNMNLGNRSFKKIVGYRQIEELNSMIRLFSYRIKKEECLDLPPKTYQYRYIEMTKEQQRHYKTMQDLCLAQVKSDVVTVPNRLSQLVKLHQISCGHLITNDGKTLYLDNKRISVLMDLLEEADNKVIIWACYRADIHAIAEAIKDRHGDTYATYYGDTSSKDRNDILKKFTDKNSDMRFFIGNPATAGYGLNLQVASTVIYYSNSYNLEHRIQSEDRAHRIGQDNKVSYVDIVTLKSVDKMIIDSLKGKKQIAAQVMGDQWKEWLR
jgi:SNF2 family DNA or RNA helicase